MTKTTKQQTKAKNAVPVAPPVTKPTKAKKAPKPKALVPGPGEIVVTNGHGPMVIKAETVQEFFALHPPVEGPKKGHALTHIPTGRRISTYRARALALWVAAQLRAIGGAELWQFTDPNHMLKTAKKDVLDKLRRLADPVTAEQDMRQDPGNAAIAAIAAKLRGVKPTARHSADPVEPPKYSAPWRSGVDWVAAGKKAYETRLRNLAAKQAEAAAKPVKVRGTIPRTVRPGTPAAGARS
jgi:hypothetical protein